MTEMVTQYTMTEVEVKRLGWRCRRGLLELDIVLQRFSANHLAELSNDELVVFDILSRQRVARRGDIKERIEKPWARRSYVF